MRLILVSIVFVFVTAISRGQQFTTINYSIAEGFPSSEVYDVYEDSNGFLWFATDNGVVQFDGFAIEKFNIDKGLTDPVVFGFFEDKAGRIWFRTYSGRLCYYQDGTITPYPFNDKLVSILPLGETNFVYNSDEEKLYFTINEIFGSIDSLGNVSFDQVSEKGIYFERVENNLLPREAADLTGLVTSVYFDGKKFHIEDTDKSTVHRQTRVVQIDGKTYFSVKKNIYVYDGRTIELAFSARANIISLCKDLSDNIWVGYLFDGVQKFAKKDFSKPWEPKFLEGKSVTNVHEDGERNLWITTLENGVYHVPNIEITNHKLHTIGKIRNAIPFKNSFLVGDEAGYLYEFDTRGEKLVERKSFKSPILAQFIDSSKKIWVSSVSDIHVFDSVLTPVHLTPRLSCSDFFEDNNGIVWGWGNHSIKKFDLEGKLDNRSYFNVRYRQLYVNDSLVLLSGRIGLTVRDRAYNLKSSPPEFINVKITDMLAFSGSSVLISTLGSGFIILDTKSWSLKRYNSRQNFIADNVYSVVRTGDTFWFATEKGLATTTLAELNTPHPAFKYLSRKSGLISDKINFLIVKSNEVLAFADEGVSVIPLPIKRYASTRPTFYIKQIDVNQQPRKPKDLSTLTHSENNINIRFGYRSFNNPFIFTRYKIRGEDTWNYSANNQVQFNALAPGQYDLNFQYSVDNVHWSNVSNVPTIIITPPWWQTWYFKLFMGVVTGLLIYGYIRYQVATARRHQLKLIQSELEAIEQERKRIAKDLHDSVGTDFSAIKMMVSQLLKKHNEPKSQEIETQFQSTIQDIKTIIYGLSPPGIERYGLMAALKNYVEKLNGSIPVTIDLKTFGPEIKNTKITLAIFRIIQELISNTLKHADATAIRLHVSVFEDLINIVYEDNGKGFQWNGQSKGLGLYNIESRLHSLGGKLRFDSGSFGVSYTIDIPAEVHSA